MHDHRKTFLFLKFLAHQHQKSPHVQFHIFFLKPKSLDWLIKQLEIGKEIVKFAGSLHIDDQIKHAIHSGKSLFRSTTSNLITHACMGLTSI